MLNLALLVFMPVSMLASYVQGFRVAPYPVSPIVGRDFLVVYGVVLLIGLWIFKKRPTK